MKLSGRVYDFGDDTPSAHLRAISTELAEQGYINGEEDPGLCETQPLYDLSELVERLALEVQVLEPTPGPFLSRAAGVMVSCDMRTMPDALYDPPEIEYLDGAPYPKVSPKLSHSLVQAAMIRVLENASQGHGLVLPELRVHPAQRVSEKRTEFVPDVAYIGRERLLAIPAERREKPPFAPEIAVEVRSPSDDLKYLAQKFDRYLSTGAVLVLDVDPQERRIVAHARTGVRTYEPGETFAHSAVPWLRFAVCELFTDLDLLA